jgi:hypothetical protein
MITSSDPGEPWRRRADELAEWAGRYLLNRADCVGRYYRNKDGEVEQVTRKHEALGLPVSVVRRHFQATATEDVIGLHSTRYCPDGVCRSKWAATDLDRHDEADDPEATLRAALAWHQRLIDLRFRPLLIDSNGRGGFRNLVIFDRPTPTADVFRFLQWMVRDWKDYGLPAEPETFPKQPSVGPPGSGNGSYGNWLRIPGRHHKRDHWSRFWVDGRWLEGDEAIDLLLATTGDTASLIPAEALIAPGPPHDRPARKIVQKTPTTPHNAARPTGESGERSEPESEDRPYVPGLKSKIKAARQALRYLGPGVRDPSGREYVSDYALWLEIGMSLYELGDDGLRLWIEWSRGCPEKFSVPACREKWASFGRGNVTFGTLRFAATAAGWPGWRRR